MDEDKSARAQTAEPVEDAEAVRAPQDALDTMPHVEGAEVKGGATQDSPIVPDDHARPVDQRDDHDSPTHVTGTETQGDPAEERLIAADDHADPVDQRDDHDSPDHVAGTETQGDPAEGSAIVPGEQAAPEEPQDQLPSADDPDPGIGQDQPGDPQDDDGLAVAAGPADSLPDASPDVPPVVPPDVPPEAPSATADLKPILEALIFASPDPLTRKAIDKLMASELAEDIDAAIEALKRDYDRAGGLQLVEVAGGYQIVTRSELHDWVRRLFHERTTQKLTVAALETLAVIAYKQPLTALEITEIRGVNSAGVLNTLLERHLVKIVGRKKVVGRPFMYATTKEFLIRFGLNDLGDLPKVEDMAEALGIEVPLLIERLPSEDALPLDEPDASDDAADDASDEEPSENEPSGSVH